MELTVAQFIEILAFGVLAGGFSSLIGIGGGALIVPFLTLVIGVDIHAAIAASLVAVIATSVGAASSYVRDGLANLRVAIFLEVATTTGAVIGAVLAGWASPSFLFGLFGVVLAYSAVMMLVPRRSTPDLAAYRHLDLSGEYRQGVALVPYAPQRPVLGLGLMATAGVTSGLLGVGGGAVTVPALDLAMRLPIKVSAATSNLMIGVTAAAGAVVFLARGDLDPLLATPVAVGVAVGSTVGSLLLVRMEPTLVRRLFVGVLIVVAVRMLWQGFA